MHHHLRRAGRARGEHHPFGVVARAPASAAAARRAGRSARGQRSRAPAAASSDDDRVDLGGRDHGGQCSAGGRAGTARCGARGRRARSAPARRRADRAVRSSTERPASSGSAPPSAVPAAMSASATSRAAPQSWRSARRGEALSVSRRDRPSAAALIELTKSPKVTGKKTSSAAVNGIEAQLVFQRGHDDREAERSGVRTPAGPGRRSAAPASSPGGGDLVNFAEITGLSVV